VIDEFVGALFLERDDDESNEYVDEEERKDDEVDDVEERHLHAVVGLRALVLVRRIHRMDQHPGSPHQPPQIYTVRQKKRNRFSLVCIFLVLERNW